ncbi:hypothetical protein HUU05_05370 [candidate division KSB1 bacterium]|nr:hypothetical protein [candidate division KSB1 bacterium]
MKNSLKFILAFVLCYGFFGTTLDVRAQTLGKPSWSKKLSTRTVFFREGWSREFALKKPAHVVAMLQLSADTNWEDAARPAALLSIAVDGRLCSHLVTYAGKEYHPYEVHLGLVPEGLHTLEILRADTTEAKIEMRIVNVQIEVYESEHPFYPVLAHAPVLFGRKEMRTSDVPLLLAYDLHWEGNVAGSRLQAIEYTMVFSNEAGGTLPPGLLHRWGRYTDIEWVYRVELAAEGRKRTHAYFQGKEHATFPFRGGFENDQPTLQVATLNNMFSDTLTTKLRFSLPPSLEIPTEGPRERLMLEAPWLWQVSAAEARREQRGVSDSTAISDLRNYVFVEFAAQPLDTMRECGGYFVVKYRNHPLEYASSLWSPKLVIRSKQPFVRQTAIPLLSDTKPEDLVRLDFVADERGGPIVLTEILSLFSLDEQDTPRNWQPGWRGRVELQPGERTRFYVEGFQMKRAKIMRLAEDWFFKPDPWLQGSAEKWGEGEIHEALWPKVRAGSSWAEQGYGSYAGVAWYRNHFKPEVSWRGEKMWLVLGEVEGECEVWINNKSVSVATQPRGENESPYRMADLTPNIQFNRDNLLVIRVNGNGQSGGIVGRPVGISNVPEALLLETQVYPQKLSGGNASK